MHLHRNCLVQSPRHRPAVCPLYRRQEIQFVGSDKLCESAVRLALDACLCTPAELFPPQPHTLSDPFHLAPAVPPLPRLPPRSRGDSRGPERGRAAGGGAATATDGSAAATPRHRSSSRSRRADSLAALRPAATATAAAAERDGAAAASASERGSEESSGSFDDGQWMPGELGEVLGGGAELAARLHEAADMRVALVAVLWAAPWLHDAREIEAQFEAAAARHAGVMCLTLDVYASRANRKLAFEKVRRCVHRAHVCECLQSQIANGPMAF